MPTFTYNGDPAQDTLIDRVEYHADKVTPSGQTVGINRQSVYKQLSEAARTIVRQVPRTIVNPVSAVGNGATANNVQMYTEIELPEDFLRFLHVKLSSWIRPVHFLVDPRSDQWRMQYNAQSRADIYNPVVSIMAKPQVTGKQVIQMFPQGTTPTIEFMPYVPETAPEDMPTELRDPMVQRATGRVLQAQKEPGAEAAFAKAQRQINNLDVGELQMGMRLDRDRDGQ